MHRRLAGRHGSILLMSPTDQWHIVRVVHSGNHVRCHLDGKPYLDVSDDTFLQSGKVGLWSKADAVTFFDDLTVREPKHE